MQTFFIQLAELSWCAAGPGLLALGLSLTRAVLGLKSYGLCSVGWDSKCPWSWDIQAFLEALWLPDCRQSSVVVLPSFQLFGFLATCLMKRRSGRHCWHWGLDTEISKCFLKKCVIFHLFPGIKKANFHYLFLSIFIFQLVVCIYLQQSKSDFP